MQTLTQRLANPTRFMELSGAILPWVAGAAGVLIALFTIEQLVNGWRNGFEGPEDRDEVPEVTVE